ncbi:PTS transporter subunit EIIB [Atopobacter phocae]|uniref:PTS transporter subunit EIIB n=1 Tax=Atopobacter phocae TaxID=136492 RepID=UPI0004B7DEA6|nr:PTS transporter subunit EIIB [Atopobacter phocae]
MNKNIDELAKEIINHIGGEDNVSELRHCMTRLRFILKDEEKANTDYLKNHEDIVTVVQSSGQYQVVIGNHVASVYQAIMKQMRLNQKDSQHEIKEPANMNLIDRFIDLISSLFLPFIAILSATGMIKGLVAILGAFGLNAQNSGVFSVFNAAGDAFFQFLPLFLAVTAAEKFKMNRYTALAIGSAFVYPNLTKIVEGDVLYTLFKNTPLVSDVHATFMGLPIILPPSGSYYSSVIPIIIALWFASKVEKKSQSIMPTSLNSFLTPFFYNTYNSTIIFYCNWPNFNMDC